ncbi:MAG: hypothetical protein SGPRY_003445, partial [Prymnesium sp.]
SFKACRARRHSYEASFKLKVVQAALARPPGKRIKPTCREFPAVEPVRRHTLPSHLPMRRAAFKKTRLYSI